MRIVRLVEGERGDVSIHAHIHTCTDTAFVPTCGETTESGSAFECPKSMVSVSSKAGETKPSKEKCCEDKKDGTSFDIPHTQIISKRHIESPDTWYHHT